MKKKTKYKAHYYFSPYPSPLFTAVQCRLFFLLFFYFVFFSSFFLNWRITLLCSVKSILFSDPTKTLFFYFSLISFSRCTLKRSRCFELLLLHPETYHVHTELITRLSFHTFSPGSSLPASYQKQEENRQAQWLSYYSMYIPCGALFLNISRKFCPSFLKKTSSYSFPELTVGWAGPSTELPWSLDNYWMWKLCLDDIGILTFLLLWYLSSQTTALRKLFTLKKHF